MAAFVKETELNLLLENIIDQAEELLVFFCPYFKLHDRLKDRLKRKQQNHKLRIIVVFGKNENDLSKSLNHDDYEFLKAFPNIEIAYEKRLHAKFYANEKVGVLTSLNLHAFSQNNNIEVGVKFETKNFLKRFANKTLGDLTSIISDTEDLATEAHEYFVEVHGNAEIIFKKEPKYTKSMLGLAKTYTESEVVLDQSDWVYDQFRSSQKNTSRTPIGFNVQHTLKHSLNTDHGFCIRTREKVVFNLSKPLSWNAYQSWSEWNNVDYREKYCHSCGRPHTTTVRNPLCNECV